MLSMALWMETLVPPLQLPAGDQHGVNTVEQSICRRFR
jgi:hypothetical protein